FDDPDGAFAFGDDDLSADLPGPGATTIAAQSRRPDATIAILPDAPGADEDAFDFSFESAGSRDPLDEPLEADQLAHTTLLDPAAGSGFDVSSSDLEVSRAPAAATQVLSFDDVEDADPLTEPESAFPAPPPASFAQRAEGERRPAGGRTLAFAADDPFETTVPPFAQRAERIAPRREAFDFANDPLEESPIEAGEPLRAAEELAGEDPWAAEPQLAEPWEDASPEAPAAETPMSSEAPALARAELRDMMEKIAWDAFAPVTEKIVREAIAKIE